MGAQKRTRGPPNCDPAEGGTLPQRSVSCNDLNEVGGALNYYLRGHKLKAQGDFRQLRDEGRDETFHELRLQMQFVF